MAVRTRFAPSPTGYLHIGGVRTALFNWLFARRHGGQFILRIDDTDRARNVEEALRPILDGFRWLGIDWDEGPEVGGPCAPYYQSQRADRYRAVVTALLERGLAYRDYATPEETAAERAAAQRDKRRFLYSRRWMAETDADAERFEREGAGRRRTAQDAPATGPAASRTWCGDRSPSTGRSSRTTSSSGPTAVTSTTLASAVDDHDLGITHVIRAVEHLSNTPRQIFIADGLGFERPRYAHLPYVAAPGGSEKLSKRKLGKYLKQNEFRQVHDHGAAVMAALGEEVSPERFNPVMVEFYRDVGYRPEALVNYLLLLGWSLDDRTEDFTREEMIAHFSLERVNRSAASFDPQKLLAFEERRMQALPIDEKVDAVVPFLQRPGLVGAEPTAAERARAQTVVAAAGDRIKVAGDIARYPEFFTGDEAFPYDEKAFAKRLGAPGAAERLRRFRAVLATVEPFEAGALEAALHGFVAAEQLKIGQIIHAVRVAVTGKGVGFGLFEALEILGRASTLARIDRALDAAGDRRGRGES